MDLTLREGYSIQFCINLSKLIRNEEVLAGRMKSFNTRTLNDVEVILLGSVAVNLDWIKHG
jgi:hypothetical protein